MGYCKRQLDCVKQKMPTGTLDKTGACSRIELERASYVMRYGKDWVQQWWLDHPGACGQFDPDPVIHNVVVRVACPADRAYARGQEAFIAGIDTSPYTWDEMRSGWWADGFNDAERGLIRLRPILGE